jgi:hypothetical protein
MSPLMTRTCWAKQGIATAIEAAIKTAFSIRETPPVPDQLRPSLKIPLGLFLFKYDPPMSGRQVQALG